MSGGGGSSLGGGSGGGGGVCWPPFTAAQWQELEHQAMIFKYLKAGLQVPPDLLAPIHRSLESMSARFLQYPTLGYYSFYGKKIDPEPGRCRRTDGKKWRCSKDAHPDSKYCERHMNRGRYRSRKHVESSQTPASSQSLQTPALNVGIGSNSGGGRTYQNLPVHSTSSVTLSFGTQSHPSQLHMESTPYGSSNKYSELKTQVELHKSLAEASSGSSRGLEMKSMIDFQNPSSRAPMALLSESRSGLPLQGNYSSLQKQQQKQHYFFGTDFNSSGSGKHEEQQQQQLVQPFFDEWPETRESSRPFLDSQRTDMSLFSSTQLSMSIEKDPSRLLARDGQSPNDVEGGICNFQV
ncbi:growth-regulating factor 4-like [Punica granatum]|uniref:Growth-regulating factor n=2 Tax=Punica granatum TaxID=22663 RepID=A0A6P8C4I1_PUNGR|nr:growth-regulating factor 4-like [Punica granatum]XP_031377439.1 growth-regulating factor 4-like [Punica granatum]XP_031377440.1 growth-regulating factor 4-like [Punica granatum]